MTKNILYDYQTTTFIANFNVFIIQMELLCHEAKITNVLIDNYGL